MMIELMFTGSVVVIFGKWDLLASLLLLSEVAEREFSDLLCFRFGVPFRWVIDLLWVEGVLGFLGESGWRLWWIGCFRVYWIWAGFRWLWCSSDSCDTVERGILEN